LAQAIEGAVKVARSLNDEFISTEHLFISILEIPGAARDLLTRFRIDKEASSRS
jgi:ATP-dependent Clp protease ATP-binding subunit ClpA